MLLNKLILIYFFVIFFSLNGQNLDELLEDYAKDGNNRRIRSPFNGVLLVAKNDKIIFKKAYGYSDVKNKIPLKIDSKFLIASVSKQFTAMLVMQQVQKERIDLKKSVSDYLKFFPKEKGKDLTIHNLLSHQSGLPHYKGLMELGIRQSDFMKKKYSPREYAELISKVRLIAKPGSEYHYSSLNYILLAVILEEVTGKSYHDLLKEHIVNPLSLKNTGFETNEYIKKHIVQGYRFKEHKFFDSFYKSGEGVYKNAPLRDQSTTYSTGGIHSTADDLYKWVRAIKMNKILSEKYTKKIFSVNKGGYAYGWMRNIDRLFRWNPNISLFSHGGALPGYRSHVAMYDDGMTIIFLSNVTPLNDLRFLHTVYLAANNIELDSFREKRTLIPVNKDSASDFEEDGGMKTFFKYYENLSNRSGYKVYPNPLAIIEVIELYDDKDKINNIINQQLEYGLNQSEAVYNKFAYMLLDRGLTEQAIRVFKLNIQNYPKSVNVYDSLGEAYLQLKSYKQAQAVFSKAVKLATEYGRPDLNYFKKNLQKATQFLK